MIDTFFSDTAMLKWLIDDKGLTPTEADIELARIKDLPINKGDKDAPYLTDPDYAKETKPKEQKALFDAALKKLQKKARELWAK